MPTLEEIKDLIFKELPKIIENDPEVQQLILRLSRQYFADKERTEDRIDRILDELKAERERQDRKWEEQNKRLAEQHKKWEEQDRKWEEESRRWVEQNKRLAEQHKKWEANQKVINEMLEDIRIQMSVRTMQDL